MQRRGGCNINDSGRKRNFIIAPYHLDDDGDWTTELPDRAPCGPGCNIRRHDDRERKTGPSHALLVTRCVVHKKSFTVYPAGYVLFARQCLVPQHQRWETAFFKAAQDAAEGERWSDFGGLRGWWTTQWRHIARLGELFGLAAGDRVAELVAETLGVDLHVNTRARETFGVGDFRRRGRAVIEVLECVVAAGTDVLRRLLHAGYVASWCGRAFWADPRWGLRSLVPF